MKAIKILGTGCPKCAKLAANTQEAVDALQVDAEVGKVTEINKIMEYGVMVTPALVIDGEVKAAGKVPTVDEIKALLQ